MDIHVDFQTTFKMRLADDHVVALGCQQYEIAISGEDLPKLYTHEMAFGSGPLNDPLVEQFGYRKAIKLMLEQYLEYQVKHPQHRWAGENILRLEDQLRAHPGNEEDKLTPRSTNLLLLSARTQTADRRPCKRLLDSYLGAFHGVHVFPEQRALLTKVQYALSYNLSGLS